MDLAYIFDLLWVDYTAQNPSVRKIFNLFTKEDEKVVNDHVAFRTLDYPEIDINVLAQPFISNGYVAKGEYNFKEKHLFAKHFELDGVDLAPRIFISQLILSECSPFLQRTLREAFEKTELERSSPEKLIFSGSVFTPLSYAVFKQLSEESEYAAWFYVFGFRANHFTVSINVLKKYNDIHRVNDLLTKNGFVLNTSGGEIKGTPADSVYSKALTSLEKNSPCSPVKILFFNFYSSVSE
jgi:hypothetical protein